MRIGEVSKPSRLQEVENTAAPASKSRSSRIPSPLARRVKRRLRGCGLAEAERLRRTFQLPGASGWWRKPRWPPTREDDAAKNG